MANRGYPEHKALARVDLFNLYKAFIVFIVVLISILAIRIIIVGNANTWVCENGQWIKHGNSEKPMPAIRCGKEINNFSDCLLAGNAVTESYSHQYRIKDKKIFTEYIGNEF